MPETEPGEPAPDPSPANRLIIPKIGVDTVIKYVPFSDYTWLIAGLRQEIAWMGETSYPGLGGNTGLAGHLNLPDGTAGPFFNLWKLKPGDQVIVYTEESKLTYRVRGGEQVPAADTSIIRQTDDPQLTLITCAGWSDRLRIFTKRLAVYADLVASEPRTGAVLTNSN
ncbi:MAG: sortase [Anaerolineales bacterium]